MASIEGRLVSAIVGVIARRREKRLCAMEEGRAILARESWRQARDASAQRGHRAHRRHSRISQSGTGSDSEVRFWGR